MANRLFSTEGEAHRHAVKVATAIGKEFPEAYHLGQSAVRKLGTQLWYGSVRIRVETSEEQAQIEKRLTDEGLSFRVECRARRAGGFRV